MEIRQGDLPLRDVPKGPKNKTGSLVKNRMHRRGPRQVGEAHFSLMHYNSLSGPEFSKS